MPLQSRSGIGLRPDPTAGEVDELGDFQFLDPFFAETELVAKHSPQVADKLVVTLPVPGRSVEAFPVATLIQLRTSRIRTLGSP